MSLFTASARAAEPRPAVAASFHLVLPPGRASSQSPTVTTTMNGMLAFSMSENTVPIA